MNRRSFLFTVLALVLATLATAMKSAMAVRPLLCDIPCSAQTATSSADAAPCRIHGIDGQCRVQAGPNPSLACVDVEGDPIH